MAKCSKCQRKRNKNSFASAKTEVKMYYANSTASSPAVSVGFKEDMYINDKFFRAGNVVNMSQVNALSLMGNGAPIWINS